MQINILTVNKNNIIKLKEIYNFLNTKKHKVEIFLGKKANKYKNKSDGNNQVKKSIYENTKNIVFKNCKSDNDFVLVLQSDAVFSNKDKVLKGINIAEDFLIKNKDIDMFMLGYHPSIVYNNTNNSKIIKINYAIHWQSVILRKSLFEKYPEISYGIHSDVYLASKMKNNIVCYGLKEPIFKQDIGRYIKRKIEYGIFYNLRCKFRYGDPLKYLLYFCIILIFFIQYKTNIIKL